MKIQQVTENVHVVTGTNVNWTLVTEGEAVTVVDAGYPNDRGDLLASLSLIGRRPEDVAARLQRSGFALGKTELRRYNNGWVLFSRPN